MNFDGGHYYLTVVAPIKREVVKGEDGADRSPQQNLRNALSTLPVAQQDRHTVNRPFNSPFARVPGTHFLRFFIVDELRFNGRRPSNPIYDVLTNVNMLRAEKVDELIDPFLVMAIDFDAENGDDASLQAYTDQMWFRAEKAVRLIFEHCVGFEEVQDAGTFFTYIKKCQVKTTMPYTDYWTIPMPRWALPGKIGRALGAIGFVSLALAASGLWPASPLALIGWTLAVAAVVCFAIVWQVGSAVWPKAPHSDLKSVLKSLYLQQRFVTFSTRNQGATDQELYDAFGAFCEAHKPGDLDGPTQAAGTPFTKEGTS